MSLPAQSNPNWLVVSTTNSLPEAAIIIGRLHSLGCPAHYVNKPAIIGLPGGTVKVIVPESHYNFAMATLYPDDSIPLLGDCDLDDMDGEDFDA